MSTDPTDLIREASAALDGITPGEWELHEGYDQIDVRVAKERGSYVPITDSRDLWSDPDDLDDHSDDATWADLRLIAAAPDLVRRLRDALAASEESTERVGRALAAERWSLAAQKVETETLTAALAEANVTIAALCEREENAGHEAETERFRAIEATQELMEAREAIERIRALADEWEAGVGGTVAALALRRAIEGPQS